LLKLLVDKTKMASELQASGGTGKRAASLRKKVRLVGGAHSVVMNS
jgi:hypothetical protein